MLKSTANTSESLGSAVKSLAPEPNRNSKARVVLSRFLILMALVCMGTAAASDVTWDGGGADNNWATAANWSGDAVPTATDNVVFNGTSSKACEVSDARTIVNVTFTNAFTGSFTVLASGDLTIDGNLVHQGGTLSVSGTVTVSAGSFATFVGLTSAAASSVTVNGALTLAGGTTSIAGTVTVNGGDFSNSATLTIQNGGVLDTLAAIGYSNTGSVTETGSGQVRRNASFISITDSAGTDIGSILVGGLLYVTLRDSDENRQGNAKDTTTVVVESIATGDQETLTVTELANSSAAFRNATGLPTVSGAANPGDGTLQYDGSEDIQVTYTDNEHTADVISGTMLPQAYVWDGEGADSDWSTKENWTTDTLPRTVDDITFDGTSPNPCVVTDTRTVGSLAIDAAYLGQLQVAGTGSLRVNKGAFQQAGGLVIDGELKIINGTFANNGSITVDAGGILDARLAVDFTNTGTIVEQTGGYVARNAQDLLFSTSSGDLVWFVNVGTPLFATLKDDDENSDGTATDTVQLKIQSPTTGDSETITLTETAAASAEFRNLVGLPTASGAANPGDGTLQMLAGEDIRAVYEDAEDAGDVLLRNILPRVMVWAPINGSTDGNDARNWSGKREPTRFDSLLVDGTTTSDCFFANQLECFNLTVESGYTGNVIIDDDFTIFGTVTVRGGFVEASPDPSIVLKGNLALEGGTTVWRGLVEGSVSITGGTLTYAYDWWHDTWKTHDLKLAGNFTQSGGTVDLPRESNIYFVSNSAQTFSCGPNLGNLAIVGGTGQQVTINAGGTTTKSLYVKSGTTAIANSLTCPSVVNDGLIKGRIVIKPETVGKFTNNGVLQEIGGPVVWRVDSLGFCDASGTPIDALAPGSDLYVYVTDQDENIDGTATDSVSVTVRSISTGDKETITLEETAANSGTFRNSTPLSTASGGSTQENAVLEFNGSENLSVKYVDQQDASDTITSYLQSASMVWIGGHGVGHTPENWLLNRSPEFSDTLIYNGTSTESCDFYDPLVCRNVILAPGFVDNSNTGEGGVYAERGMHINGDLEVTGGGTFTFYSFFELYKPGTISGSVYLNGGGVSLIDCEIDGDVTVLDGYFDTRGVIRGNITNQTPGTFTSYGTDFYGTQLQLSDGSGGKIDFLGSGAKTLESTGIPSFGRLAIIGPAGSSLDV